MLISWLNVPPWERARLGALRVVAGEDKYASPHRSLRSRWEAFLNILTYRQFVGVHQISNSLLATESMMGTAMSWIDNAKQSEVRT